MGLELPLSWAVVYDTCIHSGPSGVRKIRKLFKEVPPNRGGKETDWTEAYVAARKQWLSSFSNPVVQKTTYRMEVFEDLIFDDNWFLETPFTIGGPFDLTVC